MGEVRIQNIHTVTGIKVDLNESFGDGIHLDIVSKKEILQA